MVILEVLLGSIIRILGTEARKGISLVSVCYPTSHWCGQLLNPALKSGSGSNMYLEMAPQGG